ncbi:MAG TPA: aminotransferase class I/II-fold pyridoxal phosphate-dependent enzyme, partial [Longimicrobiaceae bacterium]
MPVLTAAEEQISFAAWTRQTQQSVLREILALISRPGVLSFALGMPAAELFPVRGWARAAQQVLDADPESLQYGMPLERLRAHVVELMALRGVQCTTAEVFITTGAQQAMSLLGQLLVSPGGTVLTEELTYDGMLGSLRPLQPRVLTVPCRPRTGMDLDALEALLGAGERPSLVYTMPEGHNPLGASIPGPARRRLADLAARFRVPVIEDDAYGLLSYDEQAPPALRAYDPRWILYVGSFSKILAPSIRTGWVVAPEPVVRQLSILKQGNDLDVSTFAHHALCAFMDAEPFSEHLAHLRTEYRARRDAMLQALGEHFPAEARWCHPGSGMFVWVEMPEGVDTTELLRRAVDEESVAFVPGRAFCAAGGARGGDALRLNFSRLSADRIHDGIRRLGRVLQPRAGVIPLPAGFTVARPPEPDLVIPIPLAIPEAPRRALYPVGEMPPLGHVPPRMHAWTVRADRYGEPMDALRVEVTPTPPLGPGDVLVYVMAAGINYNNVWAALGHPLDVIAHRRRQGAEEDFHIGGCDASGIVWQTGERVTGLRVGDEVVLHGGVWDAACPVLRATGDPVLSPTFRAWGYEANWGSFAQFARAQAHQCVPKPAHLSWEEAAAYMTSLTSAYRMLHRWAPHTVRAGDVVLVWGGAGGLGCMGVQLARVAGAHPVAVVSSGERVEFCRSLGAVGCVDRRDFDHWGAMPGIDAAGHRRFLEGARAFLDAVRAAAGGRARPRIVFEHPGRDTLATSVYAC